MSGLGKPLGAILEEPGSEYFKWWRGAESNRRHYDFQSYALPTELPRHYGTAQQKNSHDNRRSVEATKDRLQMFLKNLRGSDEARHGRDFWERHAQHDPLWAILSDPTKKGRKWPLAEFFETGEREISVALHTVAACGLTINRRTALDFGCGVGRLTQALARHFDSAVGVDISPTMIRLAEKLNHDQERVRYVANARDDIRIFDANTFDFIYSEKVLQHVAPASTCRYLPEFVRTLRRGGVLVFQLPSHQRPVDEQGPFSGTPMPDDAYRARIEVYDAPQTATAPSAEIIVRGAVTNVSGHSWSSDYGPLNVANHWYDRSGKTTLVRDDGRTLLPPR